MARCPCSSVVRCSVGSRHQSPSVHRLSVCARNSGTLRAMAGEAQLAAAQSPGDELWDAAWQPGAGEQTIQERSEEVEGEPSAITLFCAWFCPFAQRAWIALEEKQVNYRYVEINTYKVRHLTLYSSAAPQGRSCRYAQPYLPGRTQQFSQYIYQYFCCLSSRLGANKYDPFGFSPRTVNPGAIDSRVVGARTGRPAGARRVHQTTVASRREGTAIP